jgi:hypothetical protein
MFAKRRLKRHGSSILSLSDIEVKEHSLIGKIGSFKLQLLGSNLGALEGSLA